MDRRSFLSAGAMKQEVNLKYPWHGPIGLQRYMWHQSPDQLRRVKQFGFKIKSKLLTNHQNSRLCLLNQLMDSLSLLVLCEYLYIFRFQKLVQNTNRSSRRQFLNHSYSVNTIFTAGSFGTQRSLKSTEYSDQKRNPVWLLIPLTKNGQSLSRKGLARIAVPCQPARSLVT